MGQIAHLWTVVN